MTAPAFAFVPRVGQRLWSTCAGWYYGEIISVGKDENGQPTIDIRVEHPDDIIWCGAAEMGAALGPDDWENPLTTLELPEGVKPILRDVLWRAKGVYGGHETIECNTPGNGCYRCTKFFWIHEAGEKQS